MRAYDESYLNDAMDTLGEMLDYAVVDCGYDADEFFDWFTSSGIAGQFERGNPKFVAGMSGVEIAREVVFRITGSRESHPATQPLDRSPEYWTGWITAYYQWFRALRFTDIATGGLAPRQSSIATSCTRPISPNSLKWPIACLRPRPNGLLPSRAFAAIVA